MFGTRHSMLLLLLAAIVACEACIYEYGTIDEAAYIAGGNYTYSYNGYDWVNTFSTCRTGTRQSPILLPLSYDNSLSSPKGQSKFSYGTLTGSTIKNNGHTLIVSLPATFQSDVKIPVRGDTGTALGTSIVTATSGRVKSVKATPAQFHVHAHSEHIVGGVEYPMELHIVHFIESSQLPTCGGYFGGKGCATVLGIQIALTDKESEVNPVLKTLIDNMPLNEGQQSSLPDIDINKLLPGYYSWRERAWKVADSYLTYEGSLTTPPCTEGVLWHVMTTPIKISETLLNRYLMAVGDKVCPEAGKPSPIITGTFFTGPPADGLGCFKLANGRNYRGIQAANDRPIKQWQKNWG